MERRSIPKVRRRASRARTWVTAPLVRGEAALVALVSIAVILGFGVLQHSQPMPILGIAFLVGSATRAVGFCCATSTN